MGRALKRLWRLAAWSAAVFLGFSVVLVLPLRWADPPTSAFMLQYRLESGRGPHHRWVPLERISPQLAIAAVASEDQLFPLHYGFDLKSIAEALEEPGGTRRGASTISQQVAKNLYLWGGRSYVRKALEAWLTLLIELLWPKERILEIYLNIAEFGRGVYGAQAASTRFFDKPAASLNRYEAALLTAVLPNPRYRRADRPSRYVRQRASEIIEAVEQLGGPTYLKTM